MQLADAAQRRPQASLIQGDDGRRATRVLDPATRLHGLVGEAPDAQARGQQLQQSLGHGHVRRRRRPIVGHGPLAAGQDETDHSTFGWATVPPAVQ